MRARERDGLFNMVNIAIGRAAISVRSSPAQAGTHDHRPVFMGPGSLPAFAGVGRDDRAWLARSANLRMQKNGDGESPLIRACSLQGSVQLQRAARCTPTGTQYPPQPNL
jgi:hypothetical protein